jgi:hypothetical protein
MTGSNEPEPDRNHEYDLVIQYPAGRPMALSEHYSSWPGEFRKSFWLLAALFVPLACQLALCIEAFTSIRVVFRGAAFGFSLLALVVHRNRRSHVENYPPRSLAIAILLIVFLGIANPESAGLLASLATIAFYAAVISPVFWVPKLRITPVTLRYIGWAMFLFQATSATFGVLQAYYPGRFQPALSDVVENSEFGTDAYSIQLASGEQSIRPMGLTDMPGGAGVAGYQAFVFGLAICLCEGSRLRFMGLGGITAGLFCIYLSQIRSLLILAAIVLIAAVFVLIASRQAIAAARLAVIGGGLFVGAFFWAFAVGGEDMQERFASLLDEKPGEVYYENRGRFLESTFTEVLPDYPFGAGLGRWGMMHHYFGRRSGVSSIWAEIQITGWAIDGGALLLIAYVGAVYMAMRQSLKASKVPSDPWLQRFAMIIVAYDIGLLVQTLGSVPFSSQMGLEFWLLNTAIFVCAAQTICNRRPSLEVDRRAAF